MKNILSSIPVLILTIAFIGCSSVESETKDWEANQKYVKDKERDFPQFREFFAEDVKNANVLWDKALKIQDEDQKIEAMVKANQTLRSLMDLINSFYSVISSVESSIRDIMRKVPDQERTERINRTITDTETMIRQSKSRIIDGRFDSGDGLKKYLQESTKMIRDGNTVLSDFYKAYVRKQEEADTVRKKIK